MNKIAVDCGQRVYTIDKGECRIKASDFISSSFGSCVFQPYEFDNTSSTCYELYVSLGGDESSFESFLTRFESEDRDVRVRSINIKFAAPYTGKYAEMIDDFLTTRPWWTIKEETFEDLHKYNDSAAVIITQVQLERVRADMDSFFRTAAAINFPSPSSCNEAAMLVGRAGCVHPGWFSAIAFYAINHGQHPYAVKHTFYSDSYGTNAWINSESTNSSLCPLVNKWRCAFLATTNCSEPDLLRSKCSKGEHCTANNNLANSVLFTNASRVGQVVSKKDLAKYGKVPFNNVSWPRQLPISALYRRAVAAEIASFRRDNPLFFQRDGESAGPPRCVTAHLRRGDRAIKGANINYTEYCYNMTNNLPCLGGRCNSAVNLSHVASKVAGLVGPDVRNVFVASDDYVWVTQQIQIMKKLSPEWNFFIMPPPMIDPAEKPTAFEDEEKRLYHLMRSRGPGLSSGAYLFASLEVARRCDGFIGHMGSGTTAMFYQYMCVQHGSLSPQHKYICPPSYDMRDALR
eukprot:gene33568-43382_t